MKIRCTLLFFFISLFTHAQIPYFKVTVFDSSLTTGYYFLSIAGTNLILDRTGNVVFYKDGAQGGDFNLHPNGIMSYGNGHGFFLMDSTFTIVDSVEVKNADGTDMHEFQILPNGHFLLLGLDFVIMDLSSYYWAGQYGDDSALVKCGVVQEQDANHNVVFEWHTSDYYSFGDADTCFLDNGATVKWTHCNALELDTDGNILLSTRNFNEITKINRADSSIMWRLGGNQNQFTFVNCPVPFYVQHDIRRIDNGHITLFDNGNHCTPHGARGLEFELDEVNKIATLVWSYTFDSTSCSVGLGNVQRLDGSRTLVNLGATMNDSASFVVVDSAGSRIFQLDDNNIYRAFNYTSLPWKLHRPQITCFDSSGVTYLDAGAGYSSYAWSTGDSTRIIHIPAVIDTFYVFVPYGQDGFISSERFVVSDISDICGTVSIFEPIPDPAQITVFPNPAGKQVTFDYYLSETSDVHISLTDISGRIIETKYCRKAAGHNSGSFDLSKCSSGFYIIRINQHAMKFVKQ